MAGPARRAPSVLLALCAAVLLGGCSSVGTRTLPADRFDFTEAVSRSWKEQVLLNIVKARYGEVPTLVEVNQIVTGYELRNEVRVSGEFNLYNPTDFFGAGATTAWVDRPTLTYSPLTGQKFTRIVLIPIPTVSILHLVQAGYRADLVLFTLVHSINGHPNPCGPTGPAAGDTAFPRIVELVRKIQLAGGLDFRVDPGGEGEKPMTLLVLRGSEIPAAAEEMAELRSLLGLSPEVAEVPLTTGILRGRRNDVTLFGNSMLQILQAMGHGVEVPEEHLSRGYALPARGGHVPGTEDFRLSVRSGSPPADAFAAVRHLGTWFWISQDDIPSKRAMAVLGLMFRVLETGEGGTAPILSIGTN